MDPVSENQVEIDSEQHFDWAQSWKASLPIKITSIVLWGIALIGFAIAVIILWDREQILEEQFHGNADRIAYEVTNYSYTNKHTDEELRGYILPFLQQHDFQALKITLLDRIIEIGQYQSDSKTILRDTPYIVTLPKQNIIVQQAILTFYHTDWSEILRTQQKTLLWLIVAICLLFGLFLTWIMHKVVTQPFESLVNATLSVADGKLDTRLDTGRPDEFGQLAKFFNEMLDHINEQQEQLKVALGNAHESTKAKSVFLANMSHELRTPLNAVIGYTELLIDDAEDLSQEEFIPDLKKILSAGKHLLGLINDILDLSKIEAGKMDLFLEEFEIMSAVSQTIDTIKPLAENRNNNLIVNCPDDIGKIESDEFRLRQVLFNLLGNACKFTSNGDVILNIYKQGIDEDECVCFEIRDTGIGMSSNQLKKLFQAFSQADVSISRKFGGTGLGLVISHKFCQLMKGDVCVKSELGVGSVFTVGLPVKVQS